MHTHAQSLTKTQANTCTDTCSWIFINQNNSCCVLAPLSVHCGGVMMPFNLSCGALFSHISRLSIQVCDTLSWNSCTYDAPFKAFKMSSSKLALRDVERSLVCILSRCAFFKIKGHLQLILTAIHVQCIIYSTERKKYW